MEQVKISLVIATYNRREQLLMALESATRQTLPFEKWEVVVVDNNSQDGTYESVEAFAAAHVGMNLRVVRETIQGVSAARNRGIAESCGEFIVVTDDDEVLVEGFLETYYEFYERGGRICGGRILPSFEVEPPVWMSKYTERAIAGTVDLGDTERDFGAGKFFGGGNHGYRRDVAEYYGGYDTGLGRNGNVLLAGEEKDLYKRMVASGESIRYLPGALVYHNVEKERLTREYFECLCRNLGRSERQRTRSVSRFAYAWRIVLEAVKWGGALVIGIGYALRGQSSKGAYLLLMRRQITAGLFGL